MEEEKTRNFCIISHIDHGKSTLADRFLELTKTIPEEKMRPQYLDMMDLERERGITIKMQPCRMNYVFNSKPYLLNLIDTPGHIDFSYEVSRSLAAVEGAVLLVDATKGIQAQTIANLELAKEQNSAIVPVINKIDLAQAEIEKVQKEISNLLKIDPSEIIRISAKYGTNVEQVLKAIVERIPPPQFHSQKEEDLRALIFDSKYDSFQGAIAFCRVFEGRIKRDQKVYLFGTKAEEKVKEVGIFDPRLRPVQQLAAGEIGYFSAGIKESGRVRVGDTVSIFGSKVKPLPGYKEPQPMVFLGVYPQDSNQFELLRKALEELKLADPALTFRPQLKEGLGRGFECGFLGLLHAEIIAERLKREFGLSLILSSPSPLYKIISNQDKEKLIFSASDWPKDLTQIKEARELWVKVEILTPKNYLGSLLDFLKSNQFKYQSTEYLTPEKVRLISEASLRKIVTKNFYDKLKGISQGFASMNYEILDWRKADLVKLDVLILGKKEEAFSKIVLEEEAVAEGREIVRKLKENLPPQLFSVPLQAAISEKIIAREDLKAKRKDVIAPLYGGDYTRKRKLLEKQKKGKKKLKKRGKINIPPQVFLNLFKT